MADPGSSAKIAILGCGFMGTAILKGVLNKFVKQDEQRFEFLAAVRSTESHQRIINDLGDSEPHVKYCVGNEQVFLDAAKQAHVVILAVPPGELQALFKTEGYPAALQDKIVISLLAGVSCDQIQAALTENRNDYHGERLYILRAIPSIGAQHNDSITLIADTPHAGDEQKRICRYFFDQIGTTRMLPENLMNEATAMHATCNALTIVAVDAITDASVAEGLPREIALSLAAQSLRSAANLLDKGMTPESMKEAMSVPRGITINSLLELERGHVRAGISDATRCAIRYSRNMG